MTLKEFESFKVANMLEMELQQYDTKSPYGIMNFIHGRMRALDSNLNKSNYWHAKLSSTINFFLQTDENSFSKGTDVYYHMTDISTALSKYKMVAANIEGLNELIQEIDLAKRECLAFNASRIKHHMFL